MVNLPAIDCSDDLDSSVKDADQIHEERIQHCREQMEESYRLYEKHSEPHYREVATYWRIEFERAVSKRSPAVAARLKGEA
jgi:hypothetical protein